MGNYILQIYREEKKEIDERKKRQAEKEERIKEQSSSSTNSSELSTTNRAAGQQQENQAGTLVEAMNNVRALRLRHDTLLNAYSETIRATQDRPWTEEFVLGLLGDGDGGNGEGEGEGGDYYDADFPTTNQPYQ